jgi:hypothetical protein
MSVEVCIKHDVTSQHIADTIVAAIESGVHGSRDWCVEFHLFLQPGASDIPGEGPWYSKPALYTGEIDFVIRVTIDDEELPRFICWLDFKKGLTLLGQRKPDVLRRIIAEESDASDADEALQMIVFKEIVYG